MDLREVVDRLREVRKERVVRLSLSQSEENVRNIRGFLGKKRPDFVIVERTSYLGGLIMTSRKVYDSKNENDKPNTLALMMFTDAELDAERELRTHG